MNLKKQFILTLSIAFLIVFLILLKWNTLNQPYYWDALGYVTSAAQHVLDNKFSSLIPPNDAGHPPAFLLLLAVTWFVFGNSLYVSHVLVILIGAVSLIYAYKLGTYLYNPKVGIAAASLLLFNQLFFAQLGTLNLDLPLVSLGIISTYYYLKDKKGPYIVIASLMLLVKETSLILIISFFVHSFIKDYINKELKFNLRYASNKVYLLLPALPLVLWYLYHWISVGWIIYSPNFVFHQSGFFERFFINSFNHFIFDFTVDNVNKYNWIVSLFILITFFKTKKDDILLLFVTIILAHTVLFSYSDDLPRYFLPILPFYYILGSNAIFTFSSRFKKKNIAFFVIILSILLLFTLTYHGQRSRGCLETNLEYLDMIETHKQAVTYIEENFYNMTILTSWPMTFELKNIGAGYAFKETNVLDYRNLPKNFSMEKHIVYFSPQSSTPYLINSLNKEKNLILIKRFEKNNKYAEIYLCCDQKQTY